MLDALVRAAGLSEEGTQLERIRRTARVVLTLERPQPVPPSRSGFVGTEW
jgi:hypothetical protein